MTVPALYARVSDPRQGANYSLPAQERACRARCVAEGWGEPALYREAGVSAFDDNPETRPEFRRLLTDAERGAIDRVICLDIDRFARSTLAALLALARFDAAGVPIVFINDPADTLTPDGKLIFTIKASLAELESAKKSSRIRLSQELMRSEGKWLNRPPFGAMIGPDGRLTIHPERSVLLARILREAAVDSDNAIAERLTRERVPTPGVDRKPGRWQKPYSGAWWPSTIASMIKRSRWLLLQPEPWPTLWLAAHERPRRPKVTGNRQVRFLSGLLRCPCGGVLTYGGKRGPLNRLTIQCQGSAARGTRAHCPHRKTYADVYEAEVMRQILALGDPQEETAPQDLEALARERRAIEEDAQRLADVYRARLIDKPQFDAELLRIDARRALLPERSQRASAVRDGWERMRELLPHVPPEEQNLMARQLILGVICEGQTAMIRWRPEIGAVFGLDLQ